MAYKPALLALSVVLLFILSAAGATAKSAPVTSAPAAKPAPIMSPTANAKPDPTSKKDDGLMTEVPSTIAKQVAAGTAAGVTYIDTAQDSVFLAAACCNTCAATLLCSYWQYVPDITIDGKGGKGACFLLHDKIDYTCGEMTAQFSTETKPVHLQVRVGGECNPSAKVLNDPHLVGAHGTHFDFNGRPDKAFCLLTDRNLHINMLLRGYYSDNTENAALVVDGKAVHTWIK
ncbi:unnamed protein product [Closterium sp. Naga37s-1]|nr:unnamed protein product [Closterium sp. Naga37s-1]